MKNLAFMSCMLRNSIRTLATVLLVMNLIVNFDLIQSGAPVDDLAGRAGWWAVFTEEDWDGRVHLLLSLIPTAVLIVVSFYLSIMLWRYGTESAMVVHSSICNPWFYPFIGTLAMAAGQLFGEELYTVMSNAGVLVFIITILLVMIEVDKDIIASNDVAGFLVQVAQKGDQLRVASSPVYPPTQPPELPFQEEEKRAEAEDEDEERGAAAVRNDDTTGAHISSERAGDASRDEKKEDKITSTPSGISSTVGDNVPSAATEEKGNESVNNQNPPAESVETIRGGNDGGIASEASIELSWSWLE